MSDKTESFKSTSYISSNYDNLELARQKAAESVVNINQYFLEITSEEKVNTKEIVIPHDNSENIQTNDKKHQNDNQNKITDILENKNESSVFSTEFPQDSQQSTFLPKSWVAKNTLPNITQIVDTRASEHYASGMISMKSGQWINAIAHFTHCIHLKPKEPSYYANRGEVFLHLSDFQSAILNYKRACILDPANDEFFQRLSFLYVFHCQILFDARQFSSALQAISRALEMQPHEATYQMCALTCLAALNRHSECLALINRQLDINHTNPDYFVLRAKLHSYFRNFSLAYYDAMDALSLDSEHSEAKRVLENLTRQGEELKTSSVEMAICGRLQEAVNKISLAIDLNPIIGDYHVKRGALYRRLKQFTLAIDDLIMAMDKVDHNELHETYMQAQRQLVLTFNDFAVECYEQTCFDDALKLLNHAIQCNQTEPQFYVNRGDCFFKLELWDFALADYEQASTIDADLILISLERKALVFFSIARTEFGSGHYQESLSSLTKAITNNPFLSIFWNVRARCRYILEEFDGARKDLITGILLAGFDKSMESIFGRLFPNINVAHVLECKLGMSAKTELDAIILKREKSINKTKKIKTEKGNINIVNQEENIQSCVMNDELLHELIHQYNKLEKEIKTCFKSKTVIKKPSHGVTALPNFNVPLCSESNICGIVGSRNGKNFYLDTRGVLIKENKKSGWRKFKIGIEMK